jgi:hypothetical protein
MSGDIREHWRSPLPSPVEVERPRFVRAERVLGRHTDETASFLDGPQRLDRCIRVPGEAVHGGEKPNGLRLVCPESRDRRPTFSFGPQPLVDRMVLLEHTIRLRRVRLKLPPPPGRLLVGLNEFRNR